MAFGILKLRSTSSMIWGVGRARCSTASAACKVYSIFAREQEGLRASWSDSTSSTLHDANRNMSFSGPSRKGKSTIAEALRQLAMPGVMVQPPGFEVSSNPGEPCTIGSAGLKLPDGTLLVDAEGVSHSKDLQAARMSKNLLHLTYYTSSVFCWNDTDVFSDLFWDNMAKLLHHRQGVGLPAAEAPALLYIRRDDNGLDYEPEELQKKLQSTCDVKVPGLFNAVRFVSLPSLTKLDKNAIAENRFGHAEHTTPFKDGVVELRSSSNSLLAFQPPLSFAEVVNLLPEVNSSDVFSIADVIKKRIRTLTQQHLPAIPDELEEKWRLADKHGWNKERMCQEVKDQTALIKQELGVGFGSSLESDEYFLARQSRLLNFADSMNTLSGKMRDHILREMKANSLKCPSVSEPDSQRSLAVQLDWCDKKLDDMFCKNLTACTFPSGMSFDCSTSAVPLLIKCSDYVEFKKNWEDLRLRIQSKQLVTKTRVVEKEFERESSAAPAGLVVGAAAGMAALAAAPCAGTALAATWVCNTAMTCLSNDKTDVVGQSYRGMMDSDSPVPVRAFGALHHAGMAVHPGLLGARLGQALAGTEKHLVKVEEEYQDFELGPVPGPSS